MASEKKKGFIALKIFVKRLQNQIQLSTRLDMFRGFSSEEVEAEKECVPDDVKVGHFAVLAKNGDEKPTRFVVELSVLKHPAFMRLLKQAEKEYGFRHKGALEVPCQPEDLRRILQDNIY